MYLDIRLPHFFGEKAPATICEWHKQLGQSVSVGDALATVLCGGKTLRVNGGAKAGHCGGVKVGQSQCE
jgi:hypothetical protein